MPVYADTSGSCVAIATQQKYRHIQACTKCDVQLIKLLLMMDLYSPEHVGRIMKNKV